jgi:hypothetical protein
LFLSLAEEGGYVCAKYPELHKVLVGKVLPKSKIQCDRDFHCCKRLRISSAISIPPVEQARLLAGAPPQTTLARWKAVGERLIHIIEGARGIPKWEWLQPCEQETVCQEYLRAKKYLHHLLLPIGRTLEDIDILGINAKGQRVLAQVKYDGSSAHLTVSARKLARYEGVRFFFCRQPQKVKDMSLQQSITFVPTEAVAKWLKKESVYQRELFTFL